MDAKRKDWRSKLDAFAPGLWTRPRPGYNPKIPATFHLLLLGAMGAGKSSFGNFYLNSMQYGTDSSVPVDEHFPVNNGQRHGTTITTVHFGNKPKNLYIMDTAGFERFTGQAIDLLNSITAQGLRADEDIRKRFLGEGQGDGEHFYVHGIIFFLAAEQFWTIFKDHRARFQAETVKAKEFLEACIRKDRKPVVVLTKMAEFRKNYSDVTVDDLLRACKEVSSHPIALELSEDTPELRNNVLHAVERAVWNYEQLYPHTISADRWVAKQVNNITPSMMIIAVLLVLLLIVLNR